jgi:calcineurin-like phosphoesterase family protein
MAKKTYNEKLNSSGDLPKIEDLSDKPEAVKRMGGSAMLIAAPMQYNEVMAQTPEGKIVTTDRIRAHLAKNAGADVTCPLTAGIFINICAHANIIRHCKRPFSSVAEMDEIMLDKWNCRIGQRDTVYILGDLFFRNAVPSDEFLKRMNGEKHLIVGNHDKDWMKRTDLSTFFESVTHMIEISDGAHKLTLCHYPMMTWNGIAKGSYMIHGHIHNNTEAEYFSLVCSMPNLLNAGVDINGYQPVTFKELLENNEKFKMNAKEQMI